MVLLGLSLVSCSKTSPSTKVPETSSTGTPKIHSEKSKLQSTPPLPTSTPTPSPALTDTQSKILSGARSTLGDIYDDAYYGGGPPPKGRGACTDVVYSACLANGLNLQDAIEQDIRQRPQGYPNLGDRNINYRRAPNLIVWFERHQLTLPIDQDFQPGDVVFWSLRDDGVADHVGIVSEIPGQVIHNFPPQCREDAALHSWTIAGHYRLK